MKRRTMKIKTVFLKKLNTLAIAFAASVGLLKSETITVSDSDIDGDVKWTSDNEYVLSGFLYVEDGESLTIEAGTVVRGMPGTGANASALIVARGGKIYAQGTAEKPIIFTALSDDLSDATDLGQADKGLWGGLIVLGKSTLNSPSANAVDGVITDNIEGIPVTEPRGQFGGSDEGDDSGVIRYVSIRHGGSVIGADNEINGLTLGAVGSGTTIEYVEVFANKDDGIEFFGGTVNTRYMVAAFCGDDSFDWDQGYRGKGQFWFVVQEDGNDNGLEADGDVDDFTKSPLTLGQIYNATFIGGGSNRALRLRENTGAQFTNSIFADYGKGVKIDDNASGRITDGGINLQDNIVVNVGTVNEKNADSFSFGTEAGIATGKVAGAKTLDPRPSAAGATSATAAPADDFYQQAAYKGAFGQYGTLWTDGWTQLDAAGYTSDAVKEAPAEDIYVTIGMVDGNIMITWDGHNSVKLQTSSDLTNWQTIEETKGKSEFIMPLGNSHEFIRAIRD